MVRFYLVSTRSPQMLFKPILALAVLVNVVNGRSFILDELLKREFFSRN